MIEQYSQQQSLQGSPPESQPPQPPKKKHTVRKVLIVLAILAILAGCGGKADQPAATTTATVTATPTPKPKPTPQVVQAGEPFTIGQYEFTDWSFLMTSLEVSDAFGMVSNRGGTSGAASFQLTFYNGKEVLARFSCVSGQLQPGDSERVECKQTASSMAATPHEPPFDRITALPLG